MRRIEPESGALLWSYPWDTDMGINVSQPVMVDNNRFFISSGYQQLCSSHGYVYGLDEGILDVNTGERKWKEGRFGYGQVFSERPFDITSDTGELALIKASADQYTEVGRFAALQGKTWNYPAIADGRLLVRTRTKWLRTAFLGSKPRT